ncbi:hypothetical protein CEXT_72431 [Caerostris extrusa]|uniref:Uncharacterized protein n=1 Tax=Caerostris extrusa TaxID=172846 RepID=A0AAV4M4J5_CAEEX|nr:hypothetical protein CEXT_72431 [Caerostris extrusa]
MLLNNDNVDRRCHAQQNASAMGRSPNGFLNQYATPPTHYSIRGKKKNHQLNTTFLVFGITFSSPTPAATSCSPEDEHPAGIWFRDFSQLEAASNKIWRKEAARKKEEIKKGKKRNRASFSEKWRT